MAARKGRLEAFVALGIVHAMGHSAARLGVRLSILSYAGKVIVGARVDEAVSKTPGRLVELFEDEVSSMLKKANHSY
jgi:hypothetical protein